MDAMALTLATFGGFFSRGGAIAWPAGVALGLYWSLVTLIPPVSGLAPWSTLWPTVYLAASTVLSVSLIG